MNVDEHDRLVALEKDFEHMKEKVDSMALQVSEMHALLLQAKGARWAIVGAATVGGFLSAKLGALLPWVGILPKS